VPDVELQTSTPQRERKRRRMPTQKPGESKQDYRTEDAFLRATLHKLGVDAFTIDVAADDQNAIAYADLYYTKEINGLTQPWAPTDPQWEVIRTGWAWCNPEFGDIAAWVEKAWYEAREAAHTTNAALLVPAGVGANWWRDWVHGKARVLLLNGRLCFVHDWEHTIDPATEKEGAGPPRFYTSAPLYPKDCCLLLYGPGVVGSYEVWSWQNEIPGLTHATPTQTIAPPSS
jgi:hypothetical protein